MPLVDDLSRRISNEIQGTLQDAIRKVLAEYFVGQGSASASTRKSPPRRGVSAKSAREARNQKILEVVSQLGEASIEKVSEQTGLDKRGVGSSLYYLSEAGRLKRTASGSYKPVRSARSS